MVIEEIQQKAQRVYGNGTVCENARSQQKIYGGKNTMFRNNKKHWLAVIGKRSLASLIALCMLYSFAPTVFSEGIELTEEVITDIIPEVTETDATEEVTALSEITEMRDEFSKTFLMSDGTYTQVSYASPVHYEDENGVFQEIDNRLSVNAMTGKVTTGNGGTDVAFSQSQPQVSIDANGHNISWNVEKKTDLRNDDNVSLMNISPSYAPFTANAVNVADTQDFKALPEEEKLMSAHKAFSEMKYTSLEEGYAVNYTVSPGKVKEDILITSAENNEFVITVNAMGLTASLGDYRTVIFRNNANETVLTFDVPYMYDANDEFSTDIDIALTPILGGYEITLTVDEEWLESEDRVYPVVIDPIYIYGDHENESNIIDTMVHDGERATNCSCGVDHDTSGIITTNLKNGTRYYSYFKFIFPDTLAAGRINSASVNLHLTSTTNSGGPFKLCRVLEDWDQSTITYNDMPSCDKINPIANNVSYVVTGTEVTAEFNVTQWARDFTAGIVPNYGFMLAYDNENTDDYNRFHTVEHTTVSWRPQLEVNYTYVSYVSESGTLYINNYGSHKFIHAEEQSAQESIVSAQKYDSSYGEDETPNTGLKWTVTPLDNYVSYFGISFGGYHLYDAGTYIALHNATPPSNPTISNVPHNYQWHIFEYTDGIKTYQVIRNRHTGRLLSVSGNTIVGVSANTGEYQQWYVGYEPCTSIEIENRVAAAGEVIEFDDLGIDYNGSGADPTFADDYSFCDATVSPSTAATVEDEKITISSNFTGGEIIVTFERTDTSAVAEFSIWVSEYPGTYFIKNVGSNLYLNSKTNNNGDNAIQTEQVQRWQFEMQTDGYYLIRNLPSNKYLKVAGDSSANNQDVKTYEFEIDSNNNRIITNGFRFKVETSFYGNKIIVPKTGESNNYVLAWETTLISNGAKIQQREYAQDTNKKDEWNFVEFSYNDYNYKLIAIDEYIEEKASYGVYSRDDYFEPVTEIIENNTTGEVFSEYATQMSTSDFESMLETSEVLVIHTHATSGNVWLGENGSYLMSSLEDVDLSELKLCVLLACYSGQKAGPESFATMMRKHGAQTVIGFQSVAVDSDPTDKIGRDSVANVDCNQFAEELFDLLLNEEKTVDQAVDYIKTVSRDGWFDTYKPYYDDDFLDKIVIVGDGGLTLQ